MSRLTFWASSISVVNSGEPKPRHQSSVGGASLSVNRAALYPSGISSAGSGRSLVRIQPAELATTQSAASHLAARPKQGTAAGQHLTATPGSVLLTPVLRQAQRPASAGANIARTIR